jgi:hypothetical protein
MTEDEAKTKWCPFARTLNIGEKGGVQPTSNRYGIGSRYNLNPEDCRCIGRSCMAWRDTGFDKYRDELGLPKPRALGFCGLAGKP